jgi:hypothetical protein
MPQCYLGELNDKPACFPNWLRKSNGYDQQQFEQLLVQLRALASALYGNCDGACWMRQVGSQGWLLFHNC